MQLPYSPLSEAGLCALPQLPDRKKLSSVAAIQRRDMHPIWSAGFGLHVCYPLRLKQSKFVVVLLWFLRACGHKEERT